MREDRTEPHSAGSPSGSVEDTLTISEAAAFLGVHKNTVRNRIKDGTYEAEYIALTQLQADAFVTLDERLAAAVKDLVTVAPVEDLLA